MRKSTNGFTIVELLVVIAIIGILSTIGVLSYLRIQANARDSERSSKTTIVAEALEKYYDQNGEYPGCIDMTKTASEVAANLGNLNPNVLKTPSATTGTNSILPNCTNDLTTGTDALAYVGDGSVACNTGQNCLEWKLQYYEEGTGNIISISSRRNTVISTSGAIVATATENGFTQIDVTWSTIDNAIDYTIERAADKYFSIGLVSTNNANTSMSILELTPGVTYYFRVRANAQSSSGNWSAMITATTLTLLPLTALATANSTSQITIDWGTVTNADTYNVSRSLASDMSAPTTVTGLTNTLYVATGLTANTTYYFQVTAIAGGFSSYSNIVSKATLHLATPAVTVTANSTAQITVSWAAISMSTSYTLEYSTSSSFTSPTTITGITAVSHVVTGLAANTTYYFRVKAVNANDVSSWSTTKSVATQHLSTPVATVAVNSSTQITLDWAAISGATSYTAQRSTSSSFTSPTTVTGLTTTVNAFSGLAQGTTYYFRVQALNANDTSSWSTTVNATTTVNAPAAPTASAYLSGGWAYGAAGAVTCPAGTTVGYQVVYNVNDGGYTWPGWTGSPKATGSTQGYKYGYITYAYCQGPNAASAAAGGNTASVIIPIDTPAAPCISVYMSGPNAIGDSCAISCNGGTPTYQVAWNENDGGMNYPGWVGSRTTVANATQGYKYGFMAYAFCDGAYADSATVGVNWAQVVSPYSTPAAPTYLSPASFRAGVYAVVNYAGHCPAGSNQINATFRTRAWSGKTYGPHAWGYNDVWDYDHLQTVARNIEYWGQYQCQTAYATSPMSPESYNVIVMYP